MRLPSLYPRIKIYGRPCLDSCQGALLSLRTVAQSYSPGAPSTSPIILCSRYAHMHLTGPLVARLSNYINFPVPLPSRCDKRNIKLRFSRWNSHDIKVNLLLRKSVPSFTISRRWESHFRESLFSAHLRRKQNRRNGNFFLNFFSVNTHKRSHFVDLMCSE